MEVFRLPVAYVALQDLERPAVSFESCDRVESAGGAGELAPAEVSVVRGLGDEGTSLAECDLRSHQREEAQPAFVSLAGLERLAGERPHGFDGGGPGMLQAGAELDLDPHSGVDRLLFLAGLEAAHQMDTAIAAGSGAGQVVVGVDHAMLRRAVPVAVRDATYIVHRREHRTASSHVLHSRKVHVAEPSELRADGRQPLEALCDQCLLAEWRNPLLQLRAYAVQRKAVGGPPVVDDRAGATQVVQGALGIDQRGAGCGDLGSRVLRPAPDRRDRGCESDRAPTGTGSSTLARSSVLGMSCHPRWTGPLARASLLEPSGATARAFGRHAACRRRSACAISA